MVLLEEDQEKEQKQAEQDKNIPEPHNEICKDCLKWQAYGEQCWVHWKGKKECTLKARNSDEWREETRFR